jgi:hypothetical protein
MFVGAPAPDRSGAVSRSWNMPRLRGLDHVTIQRDRPCAYTRRSIAAKVGPWRSDRLRLALRADVFAVFARPGGIALGGSPAAAGLRLAALEVLPQRRPQPIFPRLAPLRLGLLAHRETRTTAAPILQRPPRCRPKGPVLSLALAIVATGAHLRARGRVLAPPPPLWQANAVPAYRVAGSCSQRCRSSVVEHSLGKGEVVSSILTGSTINQALSPFGIGNSIHFAMLENVWRCKNRALRSQMFVAIFLSECQLCWTRGWQDAQRRSRGGDASCSRGVMFHGDHYGR